MLIRKKLPKSGLLLLILLVVFVIALPIVHFTGVYDLSFVGDYAIGAAMAGTTSGWIAAALFTGCGFIGFGFCYVLKDYIIGIEDTSNNLIVSNNGNTGSYNPMPTQPSQVGVS